MGHWVIAFVGDRAQENHEITRRTDTFCVSWNRSLIQRSPRFRVPTDYFVAPRTAPALAPSGGRAVSEARAVAPI